MRYNNDYFFVIESVYHSINYYAGKDHHNGRVTQVASYKHSINFLNLLNNIGV